MNIVIFGFAYLLSAVLFIMALRGLSSPVSARVGNIYGMLGMVIAVATTLLLQQESSVNISNYINIFIAVLIGGVIGTFVALKINMTALPQLVAAFHSLVGLAAVFVAIGAYKNPAAFNILDLSLIHI